MCVANSTFIQLFETKYAKLPSSINKQHFERVYFRFSYTITFTLHYYLTFYQQYFILHFLTLRSMFVLIETIQISKMKKKNAVVLKL